jgi:SP family general alpha glucoside:H+ symporter-like MFS transporter
VIRTITFSTEVQYSPLEIMEKDQSNEAAHVENAYQGEKVDVVAQDAALAEHQQSLWQALKAEPKAVFWSVAVSSAV